MATQAGGAMYQWIVLLHILAAIVWIGGMFFLAAVIVPVLRHERPETRAALMAAVGVRFRGAGWVAIAVLLVTGVWNLHNRGFSWGQIARGDIFSATGDFGRILSAKLVLVAIILALSAFHDFILGPRSVRLGQQPGAGSAERERLRRRASLLGRVNGLLALGIVTLAVFLVRGLPW